MGEPTVGARARRSKPTGEVPRSDGAGDRGEAGRRSSDSQDIGSFIRAQREAAQVSIRQLAERAGVSNPYLSQIERGLRKPSAEVLGQIARGLRLSAEVLYSQAGILELKQGSPVRDAILTAPDLTERQREVLVEIYESFRANNETAADQVVDVP
ncbi:MAG TPA: helix-turn-helix domain-containing protein [Candidatus Dietzia intestinigallinarum]|nr:helix-turn-helix domain-containing protein [Candidatus Dietzia intestinigallinarum]